MPVHRRESCDAVCDKFQILIAQLYSHVIPGMQEDAAARVDRDLEDVINKRAKTIG